MKALYRKYRPKTLGEVVGQSQVTEPLENALKSGKVSHAYLFIGPRGCGKTSVARIFAHSVNNFGYKLEDNYVDIIEIDGASNRGIDNIRDLREKAMIAPTTGKYKIYIIDEVHMLTKEAFNALLKTLEEPPKHVIFIMATTDAHKVPVTITSRAQTYTFKLANGAAMFEFLRSVADSEKIPIDDEALKIIAKRGGGSFRDSLSLLDQISTLSDERITKERVISVMGLPQDEKITALLNEYLAGDVVKITTLLKDLLSSGIKPEVLVEEIIAQIVENPQPELLGLLSKLPSVQAPFAEAKLIVALCDSVRVAGDTPRASGMSFSRPTSNETVDPQKSIPDRIHTTNATSNFNWDDFVQKVQSLNDAICAQLLKSQYELEGNVLNIYPGKKVVKNILSRDNNKQVLLKAAGGAVKIVIHDEDETPNNLKKDELTAKISDIMGGEVKNDAGGNPFE
jgi:DNA polymerase III subunit gamma/tau